jgi:hypothetical protein
VADPTWASPFILQTWASARIVVQISGIMRRVCAGPEQDLQENGGYENAMDLVSEMPTINYINGPFANICSCKLSGRHHR